MTATPTPGHHRRRAERCILGPITGRTLVCWAATAMALVVFVAPSDQGAASVRVSAMSTAVTDTAGVEPTAPAGLAPAGLAAAGLAPGVLDLAVPALGVPVPVGSPLAVPAPAGPAPSAGTTGRPADPGAAVAGAAPLAATPGSGVVAEAGQPAAASATGTIAAQFTTTLPDARAATAITTALAQLGLPYVWGGNGPTAGHAGFDCSGLTTYSYASAGVSLPRTAHTQYYAGPHVPRGDPLQPGDLVFYGTSARVHHVGMYVGDGKMVNAPRRGKPVQVAYYRWPGDDYLGATRPAASGSATTGLLPFAPRLRRSVRAPCWPTSRRRWRHCPPCCPSRPFGSRRRRSPRPRRSRPPPGWRRWPGRPPPPPPWRRQTRPTPRRRRRRASPPRPPRRLWSRPPSR